MASQAARRRPAPQALPAEGPAAENAAAPGQAASDRDRQLRAFYRDMVLIRRFEERAARAYTEALIGGRPTTFAQRSDVRLTAHDPPSVNPVNLLPSRIPLPGVLPGRPGF